MPPSNRCVDRPIFDWTSYSNQELFKQVTPTDDGNLREVVYVLVVLNSLSCRTRVMLSLHVATISVRVRRFNHEGLCQLQTLQSKHFTHTKIVAMST